MPGENQDKSREQADRLHLRGLRISARCSDRPDLENLQKIAELWQVAWDLYQKAGDSKKAGELRRSLIALYKKEYTGTRQRRDLREIALKKFNEWWVFLKIGCFGFGGPMAVFGMLQDELVRERKVLTNRDFLEGAVLGDILPGPVTMDIVTYTGYKVRKWSGAAISTIVFILPAFFLMLVLAMMYDSITVTPAVKTVFACLGAAVTGLILSVGLKLSKTEIKDYRGTCILVGAFALSLAFKLDIVIVVVLAGLVGILIYRDDPDLLKADFDEHSA